MSLAGGCGTEGVDDDVSSTWDDNGSLTDRGSDTFAWDYEDRMTSATVNSVTSTFAHRGDGLRDSRTTGGNTTTFTWDIAAGLPVVIDNGSRYVYGAGLEEMVAGGNSYYYLADGLGSTMAIADATGAVQKSYTYDVYGEATATGSLANEFDFAGQQTDPTGLQYLRARYMDPETGTFISREPLALLPGWTQSLSGYAAGNPVRLTDPTGLCVDPADQSAKNCPSKQWGSAGASGDPTNICIPNCATGSATPGRWVPTNEAMSARAASYQVQVGGRAGQSYQFNDVKFDGFRNNAFIEAKGPDMPTLLTPRLGDSTIGSAAAMP